MKSKNKDWTGQKHYHLTFIKPTDKRIGTGVVWELQCECGNLRYCQPHTVVKGIAKSCGCKTKEAQIKRGRELSQKNRKHTPVMASARRVWQHTYGDVEDFNLFYATSQQDCHYCGAPPSRTYNVGGKEGRKEYQSEEYILYGTFTYNGLDRVDSSKGHTAENVVPCCWMCNRMKSDMTYHEFIAHIERIHGHTPSRVLSGYYYHAPPTT